MLGDLFEKKVDFMRMKRFECLSVLIVQRLKFLFNSLVLKVLSFIFFVEFLLKGFDSFIVCVDLLIISTP